MADELLLKTVDELSLRNDEDDVIDGILYPSITCHFPIYEGLPNRGWGTQEPIKVGCESEAKSAVAKLKARAACYGEKEKKEAAELGERWVSEIREAVAKAQAIKDKSGFAAIERKSDVLYKESELLRQKFFETKAESVCGVLMQVKEINNYVYSTNVEDLKARLKIIESGLERLQ